MPQTSTMEKTCDSNQNVCDNIPHINSNTEKTLCDEKQEDPSILVQKFSAILPSNFLNLSPRFVFSKSVKVTYEMIVVRWRDWFMRGQSGLLLMTSFYFLVSLGPLGLFALTLTVQVKNKILFLFSKFSF